MFIIMAGNINTYHDARVRVGVRVFNATFKNI